ncbi:DUF3341 domain-containing protein [Membranihabitans maritimus]|uniref:DUF3341 domain-containing protein n=1 Tax=Membranihabitans maritimus TaxID=2904244 RepID=UPI001F20CC50|nr:DUF3341 domain-containing protein [Membranihabitans maritimus]
MAKKNQNLLFGLYDDEEVLLKAVKEANTDHLDIHDVFSPFPVHGLDPLLGLSESRLHIAGFFYGAIGTLTAFLGMTWIFTKDWPMIIGGKPYWSVPAFIPITFELTVLFASIGMVVTFYAINGMGPGVTNEVLHNRLTDDKFAIAFDADHSTEEDLKKYKAFLERSGASEIQTKEI